MGAATEPDEIVALSKEHSELKPVAEKAIELSQAREGLSEAEAMLKAGDADMAELAHEETTPPSIAAEPNSSSESRVPTTPTFIATTTPTAIGTTPAAIATRAGPVARG